MFTVGGARRAWWLIAVAAVAACVAFGPRRAAGQAPEPTRRPSWDASHFQGTPDPPAPYRTEPVDESPLFQQPVEIATAPGSDRLFLLELGGKILSLDPANPGSAELVLDLKAVEPTMTRAYGLAFHPRFVENGELFVSYVLDDGNPVGTRVSRFRLASREPPRVDPASEQVVLTWLSGGHNGACLKFGPDGYLYVSTGDGGPAFPPDPLATGQDLTDLLSSVLRIDIDRRSESAPYAVPPDNPFVGQAGARPEIWCYGLRNPWKMNFDAATGDLWIGDVGWELREMVYLARPGGNYGWSLTEGDQQVHLERPRGPTPILPPTLIHSHTESRSVTGGFVYRGRRLPELAGAYIYGDYVTGKIWAARHNGAGRYAAEEIADTPWQIITFGETPDGELLVVDYAGGGLHRLVANRVEAAEQVAFPRRLSDSGLFSSTAEHTLASGVVGYSIVAEAWDDGAEAERFVALPGDSRLSVEQRNNLQQGWIRGALAFPEGAVLGKTLTARLGDDRRRIETQILHLHQGEWRAYSYRWNDEQTDAHLTPASGDTAVLTAGESAPTTISWRFHARSECMLCHTTRTGVVLGFRPAQLFGEVAPGLIQLDRLSQLGMLEQRPQPSERFADPHDEHASLEARVRSYLHVNCAHCHCRGGGGTAAIDLPIEIPLAKTNLIDTRPTQGGFGVHGAKVIAPGRPERSILYYRMAKLGRGHMPYLGAATVDEQGLALVRRWIEQLPANDANDADHTTPRVDDLAEQWRIDGAIDAWLADTRSALVVEQAIASGQLPPPAREAVVAAAGAHENPTVRDLFARFSPAGRARAAESLAAPTAEAILALQGHRARGAELFWKSESLSCRQCHQIDRRGESLGPDLSDIGRRLSIEQLIESLLEPSRRVEPAFVTHLVETVDGRVLTGLLAERNDERIVVRGADRREVALAIDEVELVAPLARSLMPERLLHGLSAQQAADLLAYLASLRAGSNESGQ